MAFKKTVNGEVDPNINLNGRVPNAKPLTNRQIREREFLSLARKLKPLTAPAIAKAFEIMKCEDASHQNQLKAIAIILTEYKEIVKEVYSKDYDAEEGGEGINPANKAPVFSLTIVKDKSTEEGKE